MATTPVDHDKGATAVVSVGETLPAACVTNAARNRIDSLFSLTSVPGHGPRVRAEVMALVQQLVSRDPGNATDLLEQLNAKALEYSPNPTLVADGADSVNPHRLFATLLSHDLGLQIGYETQIAKLLAKRRGRDRAPTILQGFFATTNPASVLVTAALDNVAKATDQGELTPRLQALAQLVNDGMVPSGLIRLALRDPSLSVRLRARAIEGFRQILERTNADALGQRLVAEGGPFAGAVRTALTTSAGTQFLETLARLREADPKRVENDATFQTMLRSAARFTEEQKLGFLMPELLRKAAVPAGIAKTDFCALNGQGPHGAWQRLIAGLSSINGQLVRDAAEQIDVTFRGQPAEVATALEGLQSSPPKSTAFGEAVEKLFELAMHDHQGGTNSLSVLQLVDRLPGFSLLPAQRTALETQLRRISLRTPAPSIDMSKASIPQRTALDTALRSIEKGGTRAQLRDRIQAIGVKAKDANVSLEQIGAHLKAAVRLRDLRGVQQGFALVTLPSELQTALGKNSGWRRTLLSLGENDEASPYWRAEADGLISQAASQSELRATFEHLLGSDYFSLPQARYLRQQLGLPAPTPPGKAPVAAAKAEEEAPKTPAVMPAGEGEPKVVEMHPMGPPMEITETPPPAVETSKVPAAMLKAEAPKLVDMPKVGNAPPVAEVSKVSGPMPKTEIPKTVETAKVETPLVAKTSPMTTSLVSKVVEERQPRPSVSATAVNGWVAKCNGCHGEKSSVTITQPDHLFKRLNAGDGVDKSLMDRMIGYYEAKNGKILPQEIDELKTFATYGVMKTGDTLTHFGNTADRVVQKTILVPREETNVPGAANPVDLASGVGRCIHCHNTEKKGPFFAGKDRLEQAESIYAELKKTPGPPGEGSTLERMIRKAGQHPDNEQKITTPEAAALRDYLRTHAIKGSGKADFLATTAEPKSLAWVLEPALPEFARYLSSASDGGKETAQRGFDTFHQILRHLKGQSVPSKNAETELSFLLSSSLPKVQELVKGALEISKSRLSKSPAIPEAAARIALIDELLSSPAWMRSPGTKGAVLKTIFPEKDQVFLETVQTQLGITPKAGGGYYVAQDGSKKTFTALDETHVIGDKTGFLWRQDEGGVLEQFTLVDPKTRFSGSDKDFKGLHVDLPDQFGTLRRHWVAQGENGGLVHVIADISPGGVGTTNVRFVPITPNPISDEARGGFLLAIGTGVIGHGATPETVPDNAVAKLFETIGDGAKVSDEDILKNFDPTKKAKLARQAPAYKTGDPWLPVFTLADGVATYTDWRVATPGSFPPNRVIVYTPQTGGKESYHLTDGSGNISRAVLTTDQVTAGQLGLEDVVARFQYDPSIQQFRRVPMAAAAPMILQPSTPAVSFTSSPTFLGTTSSSTFQQAPRQVIYFERRGLFGRLRGLR